MVVEILLGVFIYCVFTKSRFEVSIGLNDNRVGLCLNPTEKKEDTTNK